MTFADYGAAIDRTPDLDLPYPKSLPVGLPLLVEETKNGCTMGMLLCLDRKQRLIFTLGAILGASDAVAADVLEMTADNFRQCLARARRDLHHFMNNQCGLVNRSNPCRCPKKTRGSSSKGMSIPGILCSFGSTSSASGMSRLTPSAKLRMSSSDNTWPSTGITRFFSPRTRSAGFGACWRARSCAGRCV